MSFYSQCTSFHFQCTGSVNNIFIQFFLHLIQVRVCWLIPSWKIIFSHHNGRISNAIACFQCKKLTQQQLKKSVCCQILRNFLENKSFVSAMLQVSNLTQVTDICISYQGHSYCSVALGHQFELTLLQMVSKPCRPMSEFILLNPLKSFVPNVVDDSPEWATQGGWWAWGASNVMVPFPSVSEVIAKKVEKWMTRW